MIGCEPASAALLVLVFSSPLKKVTRRVSEGFESAILADFRPSLTRRVTTSTVFNGLLDVFSQSIGSNHDEKSG